MKKNFRESNDELAKRYSDKIDRALSKRRSVLEWDKECDLVDEAEMNLEKMLMSPAARLSALLTKQLSDSKVVATVTAGSHDTVGQSADANIVVNALMSMCGIQDETTTAITNAVRYGHGVLRVDHILNSQLIIPEFGLAASLHDGIYSPDGDQFKKVSIEDVSMAGFDHTMIPTADLSAIISYEEEDASIDVEDIISGVDKSTPVVRNVDPRLIVTPLGIEKIEDGDWIAEVMFISAEEYKVIFGKKPRKEIMGLKHNQDLMNLAIKSSLENQENLEIIQIYRVWVNRDLYDTKLNRTYFSICYGDKTICQSPRPRSNGIIPFVTIKVEPNKPLYSTSIASLLNQYSRGIDISVRGLIKKLVGLSRNVTFVDPQSGLSEEDIKNLLDDEYNGKVTGRPGSVSKWDAAGPDNAHLATHRAVTEAANMQVNASPINTGGHVPNITATQASLMAKPFEEQISASIGLANKAIAKVLAKAMHLFGRYIKDEIPTLEWDQKFAKWDRVYGDVMSSQYNLQIRRQGDVSPEARLELVQLLRLVYTTQQLSQEFDSQWMARELIRVYNLSPQAKITPNNAAMDAELQKLASQGALGGAGSLPIDATTSSTYNGTHPERMPGDQGATLQGNLVAGQARFGSGQ